MTDPDQPPAAPQAAAAPTGVPAPARAHRGGVAGAAVLVGVLSAGSMLLGFARDVVVAAVYGAGPELDAYLVAQGLMNLVVAVIAGALANAVVPVLAPAVAAGDRQAALRGVATALTVAVAVLGVAAVLAGLLAADVVGVLAPGFDPATSALAERLTRVVLVATVLIAGTNVLAAVAQSHRRFLWAGAQGVPFNLVMIVAAAVFGPTHGIVALAIGYVVGSAARLLLQLVPLHGLGIRLKPALDVRGPGFQAIAGLLPALLLTNVLASLGTMVDRAVASTQGIGTITALAYGWRVVMLPHTLVVASYLTVLYPAFGAAIAERAELRRLVARGLGAVTLILVPAAAWLTVTANPAVALIYGRGSFHTDAVTLTATAVGWLAPGLLLLAWRDVATRACFALGDSATPIRVSLLALAVKVLGDISLGLTLGMTGIAVATLLSLAVAAAVTIGRLARKHHAIDVPQVSRTLGRLLLAGAAAVAAALAFLVVAQAAAGPAADSAGWDSAARLAGAAAVIVLTYLLVLAAGRAPELAMLGSGLRRAAARLRSRG